MCFLSSNSLRTRAPPSLVSAVSLGEDTMLSPWETVTFMLAFLRAQEKHCCGGLFKLLLHQICLEIRFFDSASSLPPGSEVCLSCAVVTVQRRKALTLPLSSKFYHSPFFLKSHFFSSKYLTHFYIRSSFYVCIIWKIYNEPAGKTGH